MKLEQNKTKEICPDVNCQIADETSSQGSEVDKYCAHLLPQPYQNYNKLQTTIIENPLKST